ncbi:MAG: methyltransferase domain-containing protein [Hyphomicrobiaceae bacterium]|nr:methyltransferase domain-containing protein [Hyphomicrobiaceae bacterium]
MTSPASDTTVVSSPAASSAEGVPRLFDRGAVMARRRRAAARFGEHAFLLDRVADDITERVLAVHRDFANGLSIEAYDGRVARAVRSGCRNVSSITDAEPSAELRAACGETALADGHGEPLSPDAPYDLVVSALSLQLVDDIPGALSLLRRAMKPDGLLLAAMLGGDTLHELRQAWLIAEEEVTGGVSPRVAPFADVRALGGLLQRAGFALPVADSDRVTVTYATPLHLMREIKGMGASNPLHDRRRVPVTRGFLMRAAEVYAERFGLPDGRVPATFEIVTLTAWVPHDNQQKPLKPGSAQARLADVLGVPEGRLPRRET